MACRIRSIAKSAAESAFQIARLSGPGIFPGVGEDYKVPVFNESVLVDALLDPCREVFSDFKKGVQFAGVEG
jgi:hypothetical protein